MAFTNYLYLFVNRASKNFADPFALCPYCGAPAVPFTITVPTNNVELHLFSDGSSVLEGFEFTYESIEAYFCDPTIIDVTDTQGEIVVRNSLDLPMTCTWKMAMPVGTILRLTFIEFDLGACCSCAYITILDNEFTDSPLTGSAICGTTIPRRIPGTISNSLDITFYTDGSAQHPGFKIQYERPLPRETKCKVIKGIPTFKPNGKNSDNFGCHQGHEASTILIAAEAGGYPQ
ncbi:exoskeleton protein RP43-like [Macrobrachium nipponense]|uniref:exoskeleton protein RP43-like n=1 Tax=Macrobrachium nipponense TaxID=159736 RepID=UPI0030C7D144